MIWANLVHLSFNMWEEADAPPLPRTMSPEHRRLLAARRATPELRFDDALWREILDRMQQAGMNMVVLDLGDGVRYRSHPEIAVRGAWTPARLKRELDRARRMGIEPVPKLNFSTAHDAWLGPYSRCVSTEPYYRVCAELIAEVCELFDGPRLFHIGMDEETAVLQGLYGYVCARQGELFWHDLRLLVGGVERAGARAWVWADYVWRHCQEYPREMPRGVLQSNWYYGARFDKRVPEVNAYLELEAAGYDQVPTGSNFYRTPPENFARTVSYCRRRIAPSRLLGFLQTPWRPTVRAFRREHLAAVDQVGRARAEAGGAA